MNIFERLGRKLGIRMASKVAAEVGSEFIAKEFDNMTKTSDKIHVLADETLGGTLREYVEVNRRAEVGESVYTIISEEFRKVTRVEGVGAYLDDGGLVFHENYRVLEPTDIVHITSNYGKSERYKIVDRKAEVGDKVIQTSGHLGNKGKVAEVTKILPFVVGFSEGSPIGCSEYLVLDPVEDGINEASPQTTDDIIANLVKRVAQLERELTDSKRDIETWAQEVEKTKRELDDKIEMCIDDIVTLDERTQTESLTKFTQRGTRI